MTDIAGRHANGRHGVKAVPRVVTPVVALVCSAGGLDAISHVLEGLAAEFPATVIVLRHQDPRTPDRLTPILQRRTVLPVTAAQDGDRLTAGKVFVAPAGYHTLVTHDALTLIVSGDRPPYRPSADLLLATLAVSAGPRAVAVVLSGYGNDGATGATAVHHLGGVVIASDEATSEVFAMPHAAIVRDEIVDHVVGVGHIATLLTEVVARRVALADDDPAA